LPGRFLFLHPFSTFVPITCFLAKLLVYLEITCPNVSAPEPYTVPRYYPKIKISIQNFKKKRWVRACALNILISEFTVDKDLWEALSVLISRGHMASQPSLKLSIYYVFPFPSALLPPIGTKV
jgi:hypothetical protein